MIDFRGDIHRTTFLKAIEKIDQKNKALLAALYLLTADQNLWRQISPCVQRNQIPFEEIKLKNSTVPTC